MEFHTSPFPHQEEDFERTKSLKTWAYFWEPGLGKTWELINIARYNYELGKIDTLLVTAPSGVHVNWLSDEVPTHLPPGYPWEGMIWWPAVASAHWNDVKLTLREFVDQKNKLLIFAFPYHAFLQDRSFNVVKQILAQRKVMWALDESDDIGNWNAKWTGRINRLSQLSVMRRIATGSPYKDGTPLSYYSQFHFLHPDIIGISSYKAFKLRYAKWYFRDLPGRKYQAMIPVTDPDTGRQKFQNLEELEQKISVRASRRTKAECLPFLPAKLYTKLYVELSRAQREAYERVVEEAELAYPDGHIRIIEMAMLVRLRLQQIVCGFLPCDGEEPEVRLPGELPRLEETVALVKRTTEQQIIWARFTQDIDLLCAALSSAGETVVRYDGQTSDADRQRNKETFIAGGAKVLVANPAAMARGHTLVNCRNVIYYSNYPRLLPREQSEDRVHRVGQHNACLYTDVVAPDTVDVSTLEALRSKMDVANYLMGRPGKAWV